MNRLQAPECLRGNPRVRPHRQFPLAAALGSILFCAALLPTLRAADTPQPTKRPNIVIIMADDFRADWMGNRGRSFMETPNLDRLAAEGVTLENAFSCSGVCSPSRASMLTGKYAHRASAPDIVWVNNSFLLTQTTFVERLQQSGYRTALVGKWHLGNEEKPPRGFDYWASFTFPGDFFDTVFWINGKKTPMKGFSDDLIAKLAADWIQAQPTDGPPFCLIVGLKSPHLPFTPPERTKKKLVDTEFDEPATYKERKPGLKNTRLLAETFPPAIPEHGNFQDWVRAYSRLALTIDESVGTVVGALSETGVLDRTFLAFTSDQGYSLGEFGLCEKHLPYEQVMRVPMLVRFPPLLGAGTVSDKMVLIPDIAPTVLDLAGVSIPSGLDGRSWLPLLRGEKTDWREDFLFDFWHYESDVLPPMLAARTDRYKLIEYQLKPVHELYDLEKDPLETHNLYGLPEMAEVQADMGARLARLKKETGWSFREVKPLESFYLLGPVPAGDDAAVGQSLTGALEVKDVRIGDKDASWRRITRGTDGLFRLEGLSAGDIFYLAVPLERLTDYDPFVTLEFFRAGPRVDGRHQHFPLAALFGGKAVWENEPYRALSGDSDLALPGTTARFNDQCNYPLPDKRGLALFRGVMPDDLGAVDAEISAPAAALAGWTESKKKSDPLMIHSPPAIVLDTDMGNDIDDALALVMLHNLAAAGECRLLGVSVSKDTPWAAVYTQLVNARCGHPSLPVGLVHDGVTPDEGKFIRSVSEAAGKKLPAEPAEDAVAMLRRLLAREEDGTVVLVSIGFFTNLARLLDTPPDAISPLDGRTLLERKVRQVVSMAANFQPSEEHRGGPDPGNPEFNIRSDLPASRKFIAGCPRPIIFSGFEIGSAIHFPGATMQTLLAERPEDPVARAYASYLPMPYDRQSWDQTAVLQAVRPDAGYFEVSAPGRVEIDEEGYSTFHEDASGLHRFLILNPANNRRVTDDITQLTLQE